MTIPSKNINNTTFGKFADMNMEIVSNFEKSEETTVDYCNVYMTIKYITREIYDEEY